jgi:chemotaxis protein methyltransferase CheR
MLACEAFASTTPPVTILATDVSGAALHAAAAARYRERAVHHVDDALRERYLERFDDHFAVALPLRGLISFAPHNLVSDPYPPAGEHAFDLILCRNVLIYFDPATCVRVVTGLEAALRPGGRLVLGAADALCVLDRAAGVLRRGAGRPARSPSPGHRRPRPVRPAAARPAPDRAREDAMSPDLHYLQGLGELESGDPAAAVASLRRVLYLDPANELAAFALGRAHEKAGDPRAACRRYEQALRMLGERPEPGERVAGPIDASTVAGACEARLRALTGGTTGGWR